MTQSDLVLRRSAHQADIRTDFSKYRIYRKGIHEQEVLDIEITHAPGHMFMTEQRDQQLGVL
ncbi:hypothetical protein [Bacillus sp. NPDC093026]|uniref:hypothetical protein n=1 Tax=Bacillus sp. NPDC093026 TaxID=3363948 RepID=UPI003812B63B